jgi:hypothetical protein
MRSHLGSRRREAYRGDPQGTFRFGLGILAADHDGTSAEAVYCLDLRIWDAVEADASYAQASDLRAVALDSVWPSWLLDISGLAFA